MTGPIRVAFGPFELDLATAELRRAGQPVKLAPQPARVLAALAKHPGEVVTRADLKAAVWGDDTFVDFDQGLNFCIRQIRTVLGDRAENPRYVETLPRRGYRLVAAVEPVLPELPEQAEGRPAAKAWRNAVRLPAAARWAPTLASLLLVVAASAAIYAALGGDPAPPSGGKAMVAVLPFEDLSEDAARTEYFSAGVTEELTSQLARVDPTRLGVIGRHSAAAIHERSGETAFEIGAALGVRHLVTGTVRRSGNRVRISAQLVRTVDQSQIWADIFEADLSDILTVQRRIGEAIARQVLARLSVAGLSPRPTVDPAVYDFYLRGRFYWNRRQAPATERAIASFKEALRLDPAFAPAYAGLGDCFMVTTGYSEALAAADRAIELDETIAEAHATRGHALMHQLRWAEAEAAFRRAIALDPSYPPARYFYGEYLVARGRRTEAVREGLQAVVLDPLAAITSHAAGVIAYYSGEYDAARAHLGRALELDPAHQWTYFRLGLVHERNGALDAALTAFDSATSPLRSVFALARAGRDNEARRIVADALARPEAERRAYHLAAALTGLGEYDQAVRWLSVAVERRAYDVIYLKVDPRLDDLRGREDFAALLDRGGW